MPLTMVRKREKKMNLLRPSSIGGFLLSGVATTVLHKAYPVHGNEGVEKNGPLRRKRVEIPKSPIGGNELSSEPDMEDIWEKASRMAKSEIETMRLLKYYGAHEMSMASSDDRPSGPARPPASAPTPPPNERPSGPPVECLMGRTREEYLFDLLVPITPADILNDPSTPQGMAFDYMANDDPALSDPCSSTTIEQRYGLQVLYFSTQGQDWDDNTGWLGDGNECSWYGVECEDDSGLVTRIILPSNNMVGRLTDEMQTLDKLQRLDFFSNSITGSLPTGFSAMTDLVLLDLEENLITGSAFPDTLFDLESLIAYRISNNLVTGTIPQEISGLQNLEQLWAATNQITGNIPTQLAATRKLQSIFLYENLLTGSLPPEFGQLQDLADLRLYNNTLQDPIPSELFGATNLEVLRLEVNFFSDTLPTEIGNLVNLKDLRLNTNSLSGSLPSEIGRLTLLENFIVRNNFFSGEIPNVFENYEQLDFFDVSNANFFGSIPETLFGVSTLRIAYLSNNSLSGTIPSEYSSPPLLRDLFLDGNGLIGTVPEVSGGQLQELTELLVQFNFLTGTMPVSVCSLRNGQLEDLFSDCGGSSPEIECEFPGCCNRCFEGGNTAAAQRYLEKQGKESKGRVWN
mmetsp:Transcript_18029/g.31623  ORF Transcript_18029/g.31623 Transcript_18029/m.31623 type:complete len:629 (-) Transcript_18029:121-2007(-)